MKPNSKLQNPQKSWPTPRNRGKSPREKVQANRLPDDEHMRSTAEEQHELYKQETPHRQANGRRQPSTDVKVWERRRWHSVEALTGPVHRETNDLNYRQSTFSRCHGIVVFVRPPVVWISLTATNSSTILGPPRFPLLDMKWTTYAFIAHQAFMLL